MFTINDEYWKIHLVSPNHPALYRLDGSLTIGACDDDTKTIYVNDMLNDTLMRKVICHEINEKSFMS